MHLGIRLARDKAVQEPLRDQQLPAVLGRQLDPDPLAIGRASPRRISTATSKIAPARAAHQLVLRMRRRLDNAARAPCPACADIEWLSCTKSRCRARPRASRAAFQVSQNQPRASPNRARRQDHHVGKGSRLDLHERSFSARAPDDRGLVQEYGTIRGEPKGYCGGPGNVATAPQPGPAPVSPRLCSCAAASARHPIAQRPAARRRKRRIHRMPALLPAQITARLSAPPAGGAP